MCLAARRYMELLAEFLPSHLSHAINMELLTEFQSQYEKLVHAPLLIRIPPWAPHLGILAITLCVFA